MYLNKLELLFFRNVKHRSALVNLRVGLYRPSSWSYSCVQCTTCDCAFIKA